MAASPTMSQQTHDPQEAFAISTELNETLANCQKEIARAYIDSCEKAALTFADYQEQTANAAQSEWAVRAGTAQAELSRTLTRLQAEFARDSLN